MSRWRDGRNPSALVKFRGIELDWGGLECLGAAVVGKLLLLGQGQLAGFIPDLQIAIARTGSVDRLSRLDADDQQGLAIDDPTGRMGPHWWDGEADRGLADCVLCLWGNAVDSVAMQPDDERSALGIGECRQGTGKVLGGDTA